jgi:hypothetical protein
VRRRPGLITAIVFGGFVFLGISFLLARGLSGAGAERGAVLDVLRAQARGDARGVLGELDSCRRLPACVESTRERVRRLRRSGDVEILTYRPSVQVALTRQTGTGRVAWRAGGSLPVVQCVRVTREGPLTGGEAKLISISDPIPSTAGCG